MPDHDDIPRRRRVLVLDVTQAAAEVSRLTREAYDLTCPWSPASAAAAMRSCAGRSYSKKSSPKQATTSGPVTRRGRLAYPEGLWLTDRVSGT
jgi:hypothetical protein